MSTSARVAVPDSRGNFFPMGGNIDGSFNFLVPLSRFILHKLFRMRFRGGLVREGLGVGLPVAADASIANRNVAALYGDLPELVGVSFRELEPPRGASWCAGRW